MSALFAPPPETSRGPALELLPQLGFSAELIELLTTASERDLGASASDTSLEDALTIVDAFPSVLRQQATLGIPFEVTARTLRDLERKIREYRARHGIWGFDRFAWMQKHITGSFFEIDRLQFMFGVWKEAFEIYRGEEADAVWALADNGFSDDAKGITGHPADPISGAIAPALITLPPGSRLAVTKGDPVLHVHIPRGPNFTPQACSESLRQARRFFERHFPKISLKAISCRTWLLDPALREILPPDSNIVGFGHLFRLLAVPDADDSQHLERIFGPGGDWKTFAPKTRLQKAAKQYLSQGGRFHLTAGFLLWDDPQMV